MTPDVAQMAPGVPAMTFPRIAGKRLPGRSNGLSLGALPAARIDCKDGGG